MNTYSRYAVYYAPPEASDFAQFGARWLGWDAASSQQMAYPECGIDVAAITATPRKYGFHGTLTSPLNLSEGSSPESFSDAIAELAKTVAPFQTAQLMLKQIGPFLALVPSERSEALNALHAKCVQDLIAFRTPPTDADLTKRRANGLTPGQDALLLKWGYPYVLEEFRFHLTLSGRLDAATAEATYAVLSELTAPFCTDPFEVADLALFGERGEDGQFEIIRRYPLTG